MLSPLTVSKRVVRTHFIALREFSKDGCSQMAAALAFYGVFSLAPLIALLIAFGGLFIEPDSLEGSIGETLRELVGPEAAKQVQTALLYIGKPSIKDAGSILGLIALAFGGIRFVYQLQYALNRVWDAKHPEGLKGIQKFFIKKALSFAMILLAAGLLLLTFLVSAGLAAFGPVIAAYFPEFLSTSILVSINSGIGVTFVWVLFAMMYKFLPDTPVSWKEAICGGLTASLLFSLGKLAIGLYISNSSLSSTYGAAASLVIILLWVYYTGNVFLFGAQVSRAQQEQANMLQES